MTLENLVGRTLETVSPDVNAIGRLLGVAQLSMKDAALPTVSHAGKFDMAYKAILQSANAALQASGYRALTSHPGYQRNLIKTLSFTIELDDIVVSALEKLCLQRNAMENSGVAASELMADEAAKQAERLHELVVRRVTTRK